MEYQSTAKQVGRARNASGGHSRIHTHTHHYLICSIHVQKGRGSPGISSPYANIKFMYVSVRRG